MTVYSTNNQESYYAGAAKQVAFKSVQAWKSAKTGASPITAQQDISHNLEMAASGKVGRFNQELDTAMAYAPTNKPANTANNKTESFQFSDVVDIVNPLQHLPLVSMVYRGLTGDTINPASQVIGGALYGGPVGAVTGTINAVSRIQTGRDIVEHMLGFAGLNNDTPQQQNTPSLMMGFSGLGQAAPYQGDLDDPATRLEHAAKTLRHTPANAGILEELPGSTLSFVDLAEPNRAYYYDQAADGRTAGKMLIQATDEEITKAWNENNRKKVTETPPEKVNLDQLPAWEAVNTISLSAIPPKKDF